MSETLASGLRTTTTYMFAPDIEDGIRSQVWDLLSAWSVPQLAGSVSVSRLAGGASNVNLKVECGQNSYALRLCMPDSQRWGVSREAAIQAQQDAAAMGLAPAIVAQRLPEGHFLSQFIAGTVLTPQLLREEALIPRVAETLRALNAGSTTAREFSPFDDMRIFVELGAAEGAVQPDGFDLMLARAFRVEALFRTRGMPRAFCHSDLVPQNFIITDDAFRLVDFDYAGTGWVAFEMASFSCQAGLDDDETALFLRSYDPDADESQRARVELMRFVAGVREAAWAVMAEPILGAHTLPMDGWTYQGYAASNLEQAERVLGGDFDSYLSLARQIRPGARF